MNKQITPPPRHLQNSNTEDVTLSIIIVSYNTADITIDCLRSIFNAIWRCEYEVIVVDNNSSDNSLSRIRKEYPQVKVIVNNENRLFAIANNQGASIAKGKYLLLLNSDTLVDGDNLQRMIDFFDTCHKDVICIGPKVLNRDGSLQSFGQPEWGSRFQHIAKLFHLNRILPLHLISEPLDRNPDRTHRTGWVVGACMMIPRKLYQEVGGLNENLVFYGEEPEFGYRTKRLGYKTLYYAGASIVHLGGVSSKSTKKEYSFERDINEYDSLVRLTVGAREAIRITWWTRMSYKLKRMFHPDKEYFNSRIAHETRVMRYFQKQLNG